MGRSEQVGAIKSYVKVMLELPFMWGYNHIGEVGSVIQDFSIYFPTSHQKKNTYISKMFRDHVEVLNHDMAMYIGATVADAFDLRYEILTDRDLENLYEHTVGSK